MLRLAVLSVLASLLVACNGRVAPSPAGSASTSAPGSDVDPASPPVVTEVALVPEAGFIDVPPTIAASHNARIFTAFQPADDDPKHKPLVVFFNGGPGFPTSLGLMPYGTGRYTLDPNGQSAVPHLNDARWTRFANLLYVDQRNTGFSYELSKDPLKASLAACQFSEIGDAADFIRATLRFLAAHPSIEGNPVILAGESYGGVRATWMLDLLLHYTTDIPIEDALLGDEIQAHWDRVWPDLQGTVSSPDRIASQFGQQVLIQPLVLGRQQYDTQIDLYRADPVFANTANTDVYDIQKPAGWSSALDARVAIALGNVAGFTQIVGIDAASIPELLPSGRPLAFRRKSADFGIDFGAMTSSLTARLGPLPLGDGYYATNPCPADLNDDRTTAQTFLSLLRNVRTFITHARWDAVIYSASIPETLRRGGIAVTLDDAARPGVARPGWFQVGLLADAENEATSIEVRFPPYDESGHMVATTQSADLAQDVAAWLADSTR